jgi:hypothetical protein
MISSAKFLSSRFGKRLPVWIRTHSWFTANPTITKVFPQIGLTNDYVKEAYNDPVYGKLDLVFASDGVSGLWDLATMSMRGVLSCMHWDNRHSTHLIGTIVDPFTAVIYLTDNKKTPYGRSIIKRALVRLTYHYLNDAPVLFIERPYTKSVNTDPQAYNNRCGESVPVLLKLFKEYLESRTQIPVSKYSSNFLYQPVHISFRDFTDAHFSMSDAAMPRGRPDIADTFLKTLSCPTIPKPSRQRDAANEFATFNHRKHQSEMFPWAAQICQIWK